MRQHGVLRVILVLLTMHPMHPSLARLLRLARQATANTARPIQTLPQLRTLLDLSPQVINAWKSRGVSKQGAIKAARVIGCSANAILDDEAGHWMQTHPTKGGAQVGGLLAQEVSLRPYIVAPVFEWEQIMRVTALPAEFEVVLIDDAMAPLAPKGTKVRFSTKRPPEPGDAVLVADGDDILFFRVYHAGLHGQWEARPANSYYPALNSATDQLRVLGVFVSIEASWSQLSR
jgi:hypothetical protein